MKAYLVNPLGWLYAAPHDAEAIVQAYMDSRMVLPEPVSLSSLSAVPMPEHDGRAALETTAVRMFLDQQGVPCWEQMRPRAITLGCRLAAQIVFNPSADVSNLALAYQLQLIEAEAAHKEAHCDESFVALVDTMDEIECWLSPLPAYNGLTRVAKVGAPKPKALPPEKERGPTLFELPSRTQPKERRRVAPKANTAVGEAISPQLVLWETV
jgi:hypothetical protein